MVFMICHLEQDDLQNKAPNEDKTDLPSVRSVSCLDSRTLSTSITTNDGSPLTLERDI